MFDIKAVSRNDNDKYWVIWNYDGNGYHYRDNDPLHINAINEIKAYLAAHPDALQPEPLPPPPTPEQLRDAEIASLKAYLNSTDWYVARYAETGTAIPEEVKAARAAARVRIDELRAQQ